MPNHQQNSVVLKRNRPLLLMGIIAVYLSRSAFKEIVRCLFGGDCFSLRGAVMTIIYIHWFLCITFLGVCALLNGSQRFVLDDWGIQYGRVFLKRRIMWSQIRDWGVTSNGWIPWEGKMLHLYFSPEILPISTKAGKRFSKKTAKIVILQRDWGQLEPTVISYCKERLESEPFYGLEETNTMIF